MNVAAENLAAVVDVLPSLHAPTINKLSDESWLAVETVVNKREVRDIIPLLRRHGAEGILEFELQKMVR